MRKFIIEEPIEKNRNNDDTILQEVLFPLYYKLKEGDIVKTGSNASQADGQTSYVELLAKQIELDPYSPYVYLDKTFQTPKKYVKNELDWYKSMDLSIIGHEGIGDNPTWLACCTQDDKKEVNSNYGWCVFSEENGSQYDHCLEVLKKDKTTRNGIILYTRPSIYKDYKRNGAHDMTCTTMSHFFIREINGEDTLVMIHYMRSNDVRYGFICSDLSWNCFVYQHMYEDLKQTYPNLKVGFIRWVSDSMHLYDRHYNDLINFIENKMNFRKIKGLY